MSQAAAAVKKLDPIVTSDKTIACNGGGGAFGHPVNYYTFGDKTEVACNYCGQVFIKAK